MKGIILSLNLLGGLGVFLFGLKVMSEGLQKVAGNRLRKILATATHNRFSSTFTGFIVTCAVQSSSATTVMVVGFASAGLLTLYQSLGVMLGANIGTTTTAWIVSLLGFKIEISQFALPLIGVGFFSQFIRRWHWPHRFGEALVGFGLLFLGLHLLKNAIPGVEQAPEVIAWITRFAPDTLGTRILVVLVGTVLTMIFQSSSAVMAVTITCAAKGLIDFPTAAALVLGENIGTTVTAILASIGAPITARRAAYGNSIFKILGVVLATLFFHPFLQLVDFVIPGNAYGTDPSALLGAIPIHIAAFHTMFNICDTTLMLSFIRRLERFIIWLLPDSKKGEEEHELVYLSTPLAGTPELAVNAARREVDRMAGVVLTMLNKVMTMFRTDRKKLPKLFESIRRNEKTTDVLEHKINEYLANLTHAHLTTPTSKEVLSLLSMINDLERMGDHGEKLSVLMERIEDNNYKFSPDAIKELEEITGLTTEIVKAMRFSILTRDGDPIPKALEREHQLNRMRDSLRQSHLVRTSQGKCSPSVGAIFNDMLTSFEKMGDHAFNVIEATVGIK